MRNKILGIILVAIVSFGLTGCVSIEKIMDVIEINNDSCKIESKIDTHGGFLGDGDFFAKIVCPTIKEEDLSSNWVSLPLSDSINDVLAMEWCTKDDCKDFYQKYNVPTVQNGYYFFLDRHSDSNNKYDDKELNNRSSWNFTLALLDKDSNTIYYYTLDT